MDIDDLLKPFEKILSQVEDMGDNYFFIYLLMGAFGILLFLIVYFIVVTFFA